MPNRKRTAPKSSASKRPSIVDRAKAQQTRAELARCKVCSHPKAKAAFRELLEAMAEGEIPGYGFGAMAELLVDEFKLEASPDALRRHARNHESDLYRKLEVVR